MNLRGTEAIRSLRGQNEAWRRYTLNDRTLLPDISINREAFHTKASWLFDYITAINQKIDRLLIILLLPVRKAPAAKTAGVLNNASRWVFQSSAVEFLYKILIPLKKNLAIFYGVFVIIKQKLRFSMCIGSKLRYTGDMNSADGLGL